METVAVGWRCDATRRDLPSAPLGEEALD